MSPSQMILPIISPSSPPPEVYLINGAKAALHSVFTVKPSHLETNNHNKSPAIKLLVK